MKAIDAFDATMKRAQALVKAHVELHGAGRGKRPRFHSELLRAAVVTSVSAMDAYFHDKISENIRKTIQRTSPNVPEQLVQLIADGQKAEGVVREFLQIAMKDRPLARVGTIVSQKLSEKVFQDPGKIEWGMRLIGVNDFWRQISRRMQTTEGQARAFIMPYAKRRHGIVHRGDLGTAKKTKHRVRQISREYAQKSIDDIHRFVHTAEEVIATVV
jgi:hypothetical protein